MLWFLLNVYYTQCVPVRDSLETLLPLRDCTGSEYTLDQALRELPARAHEGNVLGLNGFGALDGLQSQRSSVLVVKK